MSFVDIEHKGRTVVATINRPEALNALNADICSQLVDPLVALDNHPEVGCILLTGNERAFAAGADIKELACHTYESALDTDLLVCWQRFAEIRTPKIAAVSGYALGGGCELAMMCDIIYAAENAKFGQPEIKLGLIPGMGGTQRLTRLVGRTKAMDMVLTGRMINATDAERFGLVAQVYKNEELLSASLANADKIANFGKIAARAAVETINAADNSHMAAGLLFEQRSYHALWATADAREGMQAFLEKRDPNFSGKPRAEKPALSVTPSATLAT